MKIDLSCHTSPFIFLTVHIKKVMYALLEAERPLTIQDIANRVNCSGRQVYYDLEQIRYILKKAQIPPVNHRDGCYYFTPKQANQVAFLLSKSVRIVERDNRIALIICMLLASPRRITIGLFQEMLGSSRNTIVNDIGTIKDIFSDYGLCLKSTKKDGYLVSGDTYSRSYLLCFYLSKFCKSSHYAFLDIYEIQEIQDTISRVQKILDRLSLSVKSREIIVASNFIHYLYQNQPGPFSNPLLLNDTEILTLTEEFFPCQSSNLRYYIALVLLSFCPESLVFPETDVNKSIREAASFLSQFEKACCFQLKDSDEFLRCLTTYFCFTSLCYKNQIPAIHIFAHDVKKEYLDLFQQVEAACAAIEDCFSFPVYDNEIAAIVLRIAPHITVSRDSFHLRTVLVCNSSKTLVQFLTSQLQAISEFIQITGIFHSADLPDVPSVADCDLIVSTMNIHTKKPLIRIATIMTLNDKQKILEHLVRELSRMQLKTLK